jgi:23S rRNA (guanine745-N1)-methyltransferase
VDLGCGQGYYTSLLAQNAKQCLGIDLSKEAILYASRHDKKSLYAVGSIYELPLFDESIDAATSIFTPIPDKEVVRVLKEGGYFITVTPAKEHLIELKKQLYENVYYNDEPVSEYDGLVLESRYEIQSRQDVKQVWDLFEMTPYRYKTSRQACEKIQNLDHLECTFSFIISIYRKESQHVKHI